MFNASGCCARQLHFDDEIKKQVDAFHKMRIPVDRQPISDDDEPEASTLYQSAVRAMLG